MASIETVGDLLGWIQSGRVTRLERLLVGLLALTVGYAIAYVSSDLLFPSDWGWVVFLLAGGVASAAAYTGLEVWIRQREPESPSTARGRREPPNGPTD